MAGFGKDVILAGMTGLGLDPLRGEKALGPESAQDRVDGALGKHQVGLLFEGANDLEAIQATVAEHREGGHLQRPLAELRGPLLRGFGSLG